MVGKVVGVSVVTVVAAGALVVVVAGLRVVVVGRAMGGNVVGAAGARVAFFTSGTVEGVLLEFPDPPHAVATIIAVNKRAPRLNMDVDHTAARSARPPQ